MTAPTAKTGSEVMDFAGLAIKCSQIQTSTGTVMLGARAAAIAALTDSSGGTPSSTLAAISASPTQAEVRNSIASLNAQINLLRTALIDAGITA